jgi:hypothetical protein
MQSNVLYFKLTTGEHIISEIESRDEEYIFLINPMELHLQNTPRGAAVRMSKWIPFVMHAVPTNDILEYYEDALDSLDKYQSQKTIENEVYGEGAALAMLEKFSNNQIVVH